MNSFINSQGFAKIGMLTVLIGAVVNIILDPIFIFSFKLGVQGAALATIISQFISAFWTLYFLTGKALAPYYKNNTKVKKKKYVFTKEICNKNIFFRNGGVYDGYH